MIKNALIFKITGQDGSYLTELLLKKGFRVIGVMRRLSLFNIERIEHFYKKYPLSVFDTRNGDLVDVSSIRKNVEDFMPDEVYKLAAQSHDAYN